MVYTDLEDSVGLWGAVQQRVLDLRGSTRTLRRN